MDRLARPLFMLAGCSLVASCAGLDLAAATMEPRQIFEAAPTSHLVEDPPKASARSTPPAPAAKTPAPVASPGKKKPL